MSSHVPSAPEFDARKFRTVLGHFPTGVAVVTATDNDGQPAGMAVGSFTSVSLDPPLVAFLPDKSSSSFPKIREAGAFCINVLAADQEVVCRQFAAKGVDKFAGLTWSHTVSKSPRLDGVVAWIDCEMADVIDAGDHYIVLGRVMDLDTATASLPLLFFQGGYGRFAPSTIVASPEVAVARQLRWADLARTEMHQLADDLDLGCLAASVVGDEMLILASAGRPGGGLSPTQVGQRVPFVAPFGALWLAWDEDPGSFDAWVERARTSMDSSARAEHRAAVERVRQRGWSIGLGNKAHSEVEAILADASEEGIPTARQRRLLELSEQLGSRYESAELVEGEVYDVRNISAPVRDERGAVVLTITLYAFPHRLQYHEIDAYQRRLVQSAERISASGQTA